MMDKFVKIDDLAKLLSSHARTSKKGALSQDEVESAYYQGIQDTCKSIAESVGIHVEGINEL